MRCVSAFSFSAPHYRFQNAGERVPCQGIRETELPLSIGLLHNANSDATKCQSDLKSGMDFSMLVISRAYNRCVKTPPQVHRWYKKPAGKKCSNAHTNFFYVELLSTLICFFNYGTCLELTSWWFVIGMSCI